MVEVGFVLAAVGVWAGANFLYTSVKSVLQIIWSVCFGDRRPLAERYGPWAGNNLYWCFSAKELII